MSNQLLPCPFCGGNAQMAESDTVYWVKCTQCKSEGATNAYSAKAVAAWNRRATQPAAGEPVAPKRCATIRVNRLDSGRYAPKVMRFDAGQFPDGELIDVYAAPPAAAHGDEAVRLYNAGYSAGHRDTVEGGFIEIHRSDMGSYHAEEVEELLRDIAAMRAQGDGGGS